MSFVPSQPLAKFGEVHNADETEVFIAEEQEPGQVQQEFGGAGQPTEAESLKNIVWYEIEANSFTDFGPQITTKAREYFNPNRTQGKAKVVKEEAMAGWQADVTDTQFPRFARAFLFSEDYTPGTIDGAKIGTKPDTRSPMRRARGSNEIATHVTSIVVASGNADKINFRNVETELETPAFGVGDIVKVVDYDEGPNNNRVGLVTALVTGQGGVDVTEGTLVDQSSTATTAPPPVGNEIAPYAAGNTFLGKVTPVRVLSVGFRFGTGVVTAKRVSSTDHRLRLTFTGIDRDTYPCSAFNEGETICIGGDPKPDGSGTAKEGAFHFAATETTQDTYRFVQVGNDADTIFLGGLATIEQIEENSGNTILTFSDSENPAPVSENTGAGQDIEIYWGSFFFNGSRKRTFQVERTLGTGPALTNAPLPRQSDVIIGCLPNEMTVNMNQEEFVSSDLTFLPLDSGSITFEDYARPISSTDTDPQRLCHEEKGTLAARRSGLDGYSTQTDVHRVILDYTDFPTRRGFFRFVEQATFSLNNNATGTPALGYKGYIAQNARRFEAKGDLTVLFKDASAIDAVRNNVTCFMNIACISVDSRHAVIYNIPNLTLSGNVAVEQGDDVKMELEAMGFEGRIGHVASITSMLYVPHFVTNDDRG